MPIKTQQQFREQVDINRILGKRNTAVSSRARYEFGLWDSESTYHEHLNRQQDLQFAFDSLPGRIRSRFSDPGHLLRFLHDVRNKEEAIRLGLIELPAAAGAQVDDEPEDSEDEFEAGPEDEQQDLVEQVEKAPPKSRKPLKKAVKRPRHS